MKSLQERIIHELGVKPEINVRAEIEQRSRFLMRYLGESGMRGFVLGISGGQDSLLAGMLAKRAVNLRHEEGGVAEFHAVLLPYGAQADGADALLAVDTIAPDFVHDINIKPAVDASAQSFTDAAGDALSDFDRGNVKARERMIAQYALASKYGLLVIGTDHAAEAVTGFYTKYGDGAADLTPLSGLNKRQGRQLLVELNAPQSLIQKVPTADLLDDCPAQSDEAELGVSYEAIDDYLEGKDISPSDAELIEQRFLTSAHKRAMPVAYPGTV